MTALLQSARQNVQMLEGMLAQMPNDPQIGRLLAESKGALAQAENMAGYLSPAQQAAPPATAPDALIEARVSALEQLVHQVAAPAIDDAAKAGMAVMSAVGAAMTPEQAGWVQQHLATSPQFFTSEAAKAAIDIFISEWQNFEGAAK